MDFHLVIAYVVVVWRELLLHKYLALACFVVVSGIVLFLGINWQVKYEISATIYADNQNILKPLLAQQAEVTRVQDQTGVVRDLIYSPRILRKVVESLYSMDEFESAAALEQKIDGIRKNLKVDGIGASHIKVSYADTTADDTYKVLNGVIDLFISDSSESQRAESKEAFQFIDRQVKQYKKQLVDAENALKEFKAKNQDGRVADVDARIASLRSTIEGIKLAISEANTRMASLTQQLSEENQYSARKYKADIYREQLATMQTQLDNMLLIYQESHPDVVNLRLQMEDMKVLMQNAENQPADKAASGGGGEVNLNPLYEELRSRLAEARVELRTQEHRLKANEQLLQEEYERRKRIAGQDMELAELTRDYDVTRQIYEDMLERKEKARLSMTLNVEGQGISYKVQQPAEYPLVPVGLRFLHFVILGPVAGALIPIALIIGYVLVDPRIRFVSDLEHISSVPVLGNVPHIQTSLAKRIAKGDLFWFAVLAASALAVYSSVVVMHQMGII